MDIVSTKMTNTLAMNVSINFYDKKVTYKIHCYILYTVFLVIILQLIITIICYHSTKNRSKQKIIDALTIWKENSEFKKIPIKNPTCYYFDNIIKLEDFDVDNISIDEKAHEIILIYDILYKNIIGLKPFRIRFDEIDGFIRIYDGTRCLPSLGFAKYDIIYDRIRYLVSLKSGIAYIFSRYFAKIKVNSNDSLSIEKILFCML